MTDEQRFTQTKDTMIMELDKFTKTLAVMMGYCKYAPLAEDDDCILHDEYVCENDKICPKVGYSPIIDGELTPECRKWWAENLPEAWEEYLGITIEIYLDNFVNGLRDYHTNILSIQLSAENLWKWMKENRDSWLYRKCTTCNGSGLWYRGGDKEFCISCNGTGRVAKWDVEKWLKVTP